MSTQCTINMAQRKFWTEEENQLIKDSLLQGLNYKEITTLLPDRTYRAVAVQGNKLVGSTISKDTWSLDDELDLIEYRDTYKLSIPEIASKMNRNYDKVKQKISRLIKKGVLEAQGHQSSPTGSYSHQNLAPKSSVQELNQYVLNYLVKERCPQPYSSRIIRQYGSWSAALEANGLPPNIGGKFDPNKETIVYLVDFGSFKKFGITQQTIKLRLNGAPKYRILDSISTTLVEALNIERDIKKEVSQFIPEDSWFERNGKTECFKGARTSLLSAE